MIKNVAKLRYTDGKPNLVIAHGKGTIEDYPFNITGYRESYFEFMRVAALQFAVYYMRKSSRHLGDGVFSHGFKYVNGKLVPYHHRIYAKIIYNKRRLRLNGGRDWHIVNQNDLYALTYNKYRSYRLFKQFMKPTYRIRSKADALAATERIRTDWMVFKPVRGAEGKGVIVGSKANVFSAMKRLRRYNGLLQEFIDTSTGIPHLNHTLHDMRILMMNGKPVQCYIRTPRPGSYVANVAQGGSLTEVALSRIPPPALKIARAVDRSFGRFWPRILGIDFGFENGKPYLFEINPQPGLPYRQWRMYYHPWHEALVRTLASCLRQQIK